MLLLPIQCSKRIAGQGSRVLLCFARHHSEWDDRSWEGLGFLSKGGDKKRRKAGGPARGRRELLPPHAGAAALKVEISILRPKDGRGVRVMVLCHTHTQAATSSCRVCLQLPGHSAGGLRQRRELPLRGGHGAVPLPARRGWADLRPLRTPHLEAGQRHRLRALRL